MKGIQLPNRVTEDMQLKVGFQACQVDIGTVELASIVDTEHGD
jgi:hypothetical protein